MSARGNDLATVPIRSHVATGAALILLGVLTPLPRLLGASVVAWPTIEPLPLFLGGWTLLVQAVAFWYLPSFTKRAVTPAWLAAHAGPWLLGGGNALLVADRLAMWYAPSLWTTMPHAIAAAFAIQALGLLAFAATLVLTVVAGPRWRTGVPFWRAGGRHEAGDRMALWGFAAATGAFLVAASALAAGVVTWNGASSGRGPGIALRVAWPGALLLFVLASLAHLLPRARGTRLPAGAFGAGAALVGAGLVAMGLALQAPTPAARLAPLLLLAGLGLGGAALWSDRVEAKAAGPRLRQTRPLLLAAAVLALAGALLVALAFPTRVGLLRVGWVSLLAGIGTGVAALTLLTLPVVFNQRPAARWAHAGAALAVAAIALRLTLAWAPLPPGIPLLANLPDLLLLAAPVLWLAALWPLRKPRRACPPREERQAS